MVIINENRSWRKDKNDTKQQKNIITVGNHRVPTCMGTTAESDGMFYVLHLGKDEWESLEIPMAFITTSSFFLQASHKPRDRKYVTSWIRQSVLCIQANNCVRLRFNHRMQVQAPYQQTSNPAEVSLCKITNSFQIQECFSVTFDLHPEGSKELSSSLEIMKEL